MKYFKTRLKAQYWSHYWSWGYRSGSTTASCLLLESGDYLLLESGDKLILEHSQAAETGNFFVDGDEFMVTDGVGYASFEVVEQS